MALKIAVIGAGSSYTPELFSNLIDFRDQLAVEQVTLMDPNLEKVSLVAEVSRRLLEGSGMRTKIVTTQQRKEAIAGADFIILQIRVGGLAARIRDERLPMEFGLVGNETTGAGGFACALRTIPVALDIARDIEQINPHAWLMNLSNPAGIVTEAILKHTRVRTIGFCNIPINTQYDLGRVLHVPPSKIRLDSFGLNHLSWVRGAYVDGQEMLEPLIAKARSRRSVLYRQGLVDQLIDPEWLQAIRMIPGWYLRYFYYPERVLEEDRCRERSDGEEDRLAEEKLLQIYLTTGFTQEARQILAAKGGAQYYLPVLQVIDSMIHDRGELVVVDVRNGSALPDLPPEVCVEVPARISRQAIEPIPVGPLPLSVRGLVQAVKVYEELTIQAAMNLDRGAALAALMVHPLVGTYPKTREFLKRALENEWHQV
jgi:6-phospho-beta-glucosidase